MPDDLDSEMRMYNFSLNIVQFFRLHDMTNDQIATLEYGSMAINQLSTMFSSISSYIRGWHFYNDLKQSGQFCLRTVLEWHRYLIAARHHLQGDELPMLVMAEYPDWTITPTIDGHLWYCMMDNTHVLISQYGSQIELSIYRQGSGWACLNKWPSQEITDITTLFRQAPTYVMEHYL